MILCKCMPQATRTTAIRATVVPIFERVTPILFRKTERQRLFSGPLNVVLNTLLGFVCLAPFLAFLTVFFTMVIAKSFVNLSRFIGVILRPVDAVSAHFVRIAFAITLITGFKSVWIFIVPSLLCCLYSFRIFGVVLFTNLSDFIFVFDIPFSTLSIRAANTSGAKCIFHVTSRIEVIRRGRIFITAFCTTLCSGDRIRHSFAPIQAKSRWGFPSRDRQLYLLKLYQ